MPLMEIMSFFFAARLTQGSSARVLRRSSILKDESVGGIYKDSSYKWEQNSQWTLGSSAFGCEVVLSDYIQTQQPIHSDDSEKPLQRFASLDLTNKIKSGRRVFLLLLFKGLSVHRRSAFEVTPHSFQLQVIAVKKKKKKKNFFNMSATFSHLWTWQIKYKDACVVLFWKAFCPQEVSSWVFCFKL